MKEQKKTKAQLLEELRDLQNRLAALAGKKPVKEAVPKLLLETNRRLQDIAQELFDAKQALALRNEELDRINRELESENKKLQEEQGRLLRQTEVRPVTGAKKAARQPKADKQYSFGDLQKKYIELLEAHLDNDEKKVDELVNALCGNFLEIGMATKKIVDMHIKGINERCLDINEAEARRKVFSARTVLLMVMTKYASLLLEQ